MWLPFSCVCGPVFAYLTQGDLVGFVQTRSCHSLDEVKELCRSSHGDVFKHFSSRMRASRDIVRSAMSSCIQGRALLRYVEKPNILFADIVCPPGYFSTLEAVSRSTAEPIQDTMIGLLNEDPGFAFIALRHEGCRIKHVDFETQKRSPLLVETAIMQNGNALRYVYSEYRDVPANVLACVSKFPWALEWCGPTCRSDAGVIEKATAHVKWVRRFARK